MYEIVGDALKRAYPCSSLTLSVTEWFPLEIPASGSTLRYLSAERDRLGHVLRRV